MGTSNTLDSKYVGNKNQEKHTYHTYHIKTINGRFQFIFFSVCPIKFHHPSNFLSAKKNEGECKNPAAFSRSMTLLTILTDCHIAIFPLYSVYSFPPPHRKVNVAISRRREKKSLPLRFSLFIRLPLPPQADLDFPVYLLDSGPSSSSCSFFRHSRVAGYFSVSGAIN